MGNFWADDTGTAKRPGHARCMAGAWLPKSIANARVLWNHLNTPCGRRLVRKGEQILMQATILVTGGAGFIGSNFVLDWLEHEPDRIIDLDRLTYAGNLQNLAQVLDHAKHLLVTGNISDS